MIFHELRVSDFLVFPGEQGLTIPTKNNGNLVVILAPNNTGKTSIIRALKFLLYGHLSGTVAGLEHKLVNDRAKSVAAGGAEISGWVEATIERDGERRCIRRTISAKRSGDNWRTTEVKLEEVKRGKSTIFAADDGTLQRDLRRLVPELLFDAFYFQGEPLHGQLLGDISSIRKSLNTFLHEDRWELAEEAAEEAREFYTRELQKIAGKNSEYEAKLEEEEGWKKQLTQRRQELADTKAQLAEAEEHFEETTQALQELGKPAEAEKLLAELRDLTSQRDRAKRNRAQVESELARLVGTSAGVSFILDALPIAQKILAQMEEDNILPADVYEGFVERVLAQPRCICGHDHDAKTRAAWKAYKEKTLSADLNRGLSDLLDAVGESGRYSYSKRARQIATTIAEKRTQRAKGVQDEQKLEAAVREAEERLKTFPVEEIRRLSVLLSKIASERQQLSGRVQSIETAIKNAENACKRIAAELIKLAPKGANTSKLNKIKLARDRADKLRMLISESRERLNHAFHEILQKSVTAYYDGSAYDGSRAKIHRHTLLPAVEVDGEVRKNLGGGQSQLLALAYIISLARLRKSLHREMQRLGTGLGKLDDQSFFLDSPFDKMTDTFAQRIARFLIGNARQIVLLLARHQWDMVKELIEPAADGIYAFDYSTLPEKVEELNIRDFIYSAGDKNLTLLHKLTPPDQQPKTQILKIR